MIRQAMSSSSSSSMGSLMANSGKVEEKTFVDHRENGRSPGLVFLTSNFRQAVPGRQLVRVNYDSIISSADKFGVGQRRSISTGNTRSGVDSTSSKVARIAGSYLPSLAVIPHISSGIEEIMADYVHHQVTREFILISFKLFLIVAAKDVFLFLAF
jgi:hypothetical protein